MSDLVLHGYWRSSAAYRVRIALHLKGVAYDQVSHDLRAGGQRSPDYLAIAPHELVPALQQGSTVLIESPAILEWIEATWPLPALLPGSAEDMAIVRAMAALIACDVHPLNNLRVLNDLRSRFQASKEQVRQWVHHWVGEGFAALEKMIARYGGAYAFGDAPTMADCYIVPQLYNARRFQMDLSPFPRVVAAGAAAERLSAFQAARPDVQPDAGQG